MAIERTPIGRNRSDRAVCGLSHDLHHMLDLGDGDASSAKAVGPLREGAVDLSPMRPRARSNLAQVYTGGREEKASTET